MRPIRQNQSDPEFESLFNDLMTEVFGFSFAPWHRLGLWGPGYECRGLIEDGRLMANVSISKMDLLVGGRPFRVHQFGAVAVRESCRGRGLAARLINEALADYPGVPAFLFANEEVLDFYPRFGFQRIYEHRPVLETVIDNDIPARPAAVGDPELAAALGRRARFSSVLDCVGSDSIRLFHLLLNYQDAALTLPGGPLVTAVRLDRETLLLADVAAPGPVSFADLKKVLPFSGIRRVEFGFCPDHLGLSPGWEKITDDQAPLFGRGDLVWPRVFRVPVLTVT